VRISILTSCTSKKAVTCAAPLTADDFDRGSAHIRRREQALAQHMLPAGNMYVGQQHRHLMQGVQAVRRKRPDVEIDVAIISAGYGLVSEESPIAPYERAFNGMGQAGIRALADRLNIPEDARRFLARPADLLLVLLGNTYLQAVDLDEEVTFGGRTLLFCGREAAHSLPEWSRVKKVLVTKETAKRFSESLVWLKGYLARRLLLKVIEHPQVVDEVTQPEADVLDMLAAHTAQANLEL